MQSINFYSYLNTFYNKIGEFNITPAQQSLFLSIVFIANKSRCWKGLKLHREYTMKSASIKAKNTYYSSLENLEKVGLISINSPVKRGASFTIDVVQFEDMETANQPMNPLDNPNIPEDEKAKIAYRQKLREENRKRLGI